MKKSLNTTLGALAWSSALVACALVQRKPLPPPIEPQFTPAERAAVVAFWSRPDRYQVGPPDDAARVGPYQVRQTVAGSQWLWNYARSRGGGKAPPTQDAAPAGAPPAWGAWIAAKVAFDRTIARQTADRANRQVLGRDAPSSPDSIVPPPDPGPCPADLAALVGDPPSFAEACVPTQYTVRFDDDVLAYVDHVKLRPLYAYYRSDSGVTSDGGGSRAGDADRIDHLFRIAKVGPGDEAVMRSVSSLEGGFDAVNTYDTGFVSVGFIQFASLRAGAGSLGAMLLGYKRDDPRDFQADFRAFGVDVTPTGVLAVLDPATGVELQGPEANAKIIEDKRLIAVFGRAGQRSDAFKAAQIAAARANFFPDRDSVVCTLDGQVRSLRVADFIRSQAGLATLMDRKVNTGKLDPLAAVVQAVADEHAARTCSDLCRCEAEIVARMRYRKNYLVDAALSQPDGATSLPSRHGTRGKKR